MINEQMYQLGAIRTCMRELSEFGQLKAAEIGNENIFDFSLGSPSTPAPEEVRQALLDILENMPSAQVNGYTSGVGSLETRNAVALALNDEFATDYTANDLFICSGAAPALVACFRALIVDPTSEIVGISPYFPEYKAFVQANGGTFREVPANIPDFQIDFDALEGMINEHTQAVVVNSPNNPSGVVYSTKTIERLAALLEKKAKEIGHPIYLLADEPYRYLVYDQIEVPWIPSYYKDTVVCYSYSKSLSIAGQRIGWILVPSHVAARDTLFYAIAGAARVSGHVCASSLYQHVVASCAKIDPDLSIYKENRDLLYSRLTEMGYSCVLPQGAFYLIFRAPNENAAGWSNKAKEKGLLVTPCDDFGCPSYLRVSFCVPTDRIVRALPLFEEFK